MSDDVNGTERPLRRQAARTEQRIIAAATGLFLERGYPTTTLADVAAAADVAARTVYVRFGTKAELFKRVVDVAIVGDTEHVDVLGRDWMAAAFEAPTAEERIAAQAAANRQIMARTGALFAVARQAAAVEPLIEAQWRQGREQTRDGLRMVWTKMADDGLLDPAVDLDWLVDTASVVAAAETYLLIAGMIGDDLDRYEEWLARTLRRIAGVG